MKLPVAFGLALALAAPAVVGQQANTAAASMVVNGAGGPPFPVTGINLPRGQTSTVQIQGSPDAVFIVGGSPALAPAGVPSRGGLIDLDLSQLFITFNGLEQPWLYTTDTTGQWSAQLPIPATAFVNSQAAFQALVTDPTSAHGATLSAASLLTISPGVTTQPIVLGDDDSTLFSLGPYGFGLPFYGQVYDHVWINSNGSLSFVQGTTDHIATPLELLQQMPRIAGFWTDLDPAQGGTITVVIDQTSSVPWLRVDFTNVPELGVGPTHTFSTKIYAVIGDIVIESSPQNLGSQFPVVVGISPGGSLSGQLPKDLSAMNVAPLSGVADESFYEWFGTTAMPFYTAPTNNPWDLAGVSLTFAGQYLGTPMAAYVGSAYP